MQDRIAKVLAEMSTTSASSLTERIIACMLALVPQMSRLKHPNKITADKIRTFLAAIELDAKLRLTGCYEPSLRSEIYTIDRE